MPSVNYAANEYAAVIERVIDGDTVVALVDLGQTVLKRDTYRLAGIDSPEMNTDAGRKAKAHLIGLLAPVHNMVRMRTTKADKYGRYLANLYVNDVYINRQMIDDGHAVPYDGGYR
jgi:micrococcal nuclease